MSRSGETLEASRRQADLHDREPELAPEVRRVREAERAGELEPLGLEAFAILLATGLAALLLGLTPARSEVGYRPFASAAAEMVSALEGLAAWCKERKLLRERAGVLESLLQFDPAHAAARRALGYRLVKGTGWERRRGWVAPRTTREEHHAEFRERYERIVTPFVARTLEDLTRRAGALAEERRDGILTELLGLRPDDPGVRAARGEARDGERWVLAETLRARTRRTELLAAAKAARKKQPSPRPGELDAVDRALGLPFTGVYASRTTRAVGTVTKGELRDAVRLADAAAGLFRVAFSTTTTHGEGFTIHLLDGPRARGTYLDRHPKLTDQARTFSRKLNSAWSESIWNVGIWVKERSRRDELVARQTYVMLLGRGFGITTRNGALHEGLGLYLTEALTGMRRAWFVKPAAYGGGGAGYSVRMKDPKSDWRALARERLRDGQTADYPVLLGRDVNALTGPDVLHAYVLAAYLLEGRPPGWTRFLEHARAETPLDAAARRELGRSLPALERRVARWLTETGPR